MIIELIDSISYYFHRLFKYILHLITGETEIYRILKNGYKTSNMSIKFFDSLYYSKKINHLSQRMFLLPSKEFLKVKPISHLKIIPINNTINMNNNETLDEEINNASPWNLDEILRDIIDEKYPNKSNIKSKIDADNYNLAINNLLYSLQELKLFQISIYKLNKLKNLSFDTTNSEHWKLLDKLWNLLYPNQKRKHNKEGNDWKLIGFQGINPSTDFRGCGLLSLYQLIYFVENYTEQAQMILNLSNNNTSNENFFPFAIAGINITSFIFDAISLPYYKTPNDIKIIPSLDFFYNSNNYVLESTSSNIDKTISSSTSINSNELFKLTNNKRYDWLTSIYLEGLKTQYIYNNIDCINLTINHIHEFYCKFFLLLGNKWYQSSNKSILNFPSIMKEVKQDIINKYEFH